MTSTYFRFHYFILFSISFHHSFGLPLSPHFSRFHHDIIYFCFWLFHTFRRYVKCTSKKHAAQPRRRISASLITKIALALCACAKTWMTLRTIFHDILIRYASYVADISIYALHYAGYRHRATGAVFTESWEMERRHIFMLLITHCI